MIGWVLLTRDAVAKADLALSSGEKGVVDEVGFLAVHTGFADRFFPGTSVLHTRLRYTLFVPWLIREVSRSGSDDLLRRLQKAETDLAKQLIDGVKDRTDIDGSGIIGARIWPKPAAQPPSYSYWSALSAWGLLRPRVGGASVSRADVLRMLAKAYCSGRSRMTDDDGLSIESGPSDPFVRLPPMPDAIGRRGAPIDFELTADERKFLRNQFLAVRRQDGARSLLARLVETDSGIDSERPWDRTVFQLADEEDRRALLLAKDASAMGGIGRAVYAALAELNQTADGVARSDFWANQLRDRVAEFGGDAAHLDIEQLRKTLPRLPQDLIRVMAATQDWLKDPGKSVMALWEPYSQAESARKGLRARLPDREAARKRRAEWIAEEHPTAVPLHYRWSHVQRLLGDLLL